MRHTPAQLTAMIACGCLLAAFVFYFFPWGRY
jgi:hypothetical protein